MYTCRLVQVLTTLCVHVIQALASGPGALFAAESNATADLAVKVREDPLFLIKQKEEAAKKQLASNPVKLKQLQQVCIGVYI